MIGRDVTENEVKYYVFVKNGRKYYDSQQLSVRETTIDWIFPVPESNVVGTIDRQSNGIVLIKFGNYGEEPVCKVVAKDYVDRVYDVHYYRFSSNYADDTIAYSETRTIVIVNIRTGEAFYTGRNLFEVDYFIGINFLDPLERLLVIVKSVLGEDTDRDIYWDSYLHIAKIEGKKLIDTYWSMYIGETDDLSPHFPPYNLWYVHDRKLFVYDRQRNKIICTNGKQMSLHPFSELFNSNANRIGTIKDIAIHPNLPFGVIIEEGVSKTHNLSLASHRSR